MGENHRAGPRGVTAPEPGTLPRARLVRCLIGCFPGKTASSMLFPAILLPAFVGELSLALWLTVKEVHVSKWQEQSALSA